MTPVKAPVTARSLSTRTPSWWGPVGQADSRRESSWAGEASTCPQVRVTGASCRWEGSAWLSTEMVPQAAPVMEQADSTSRLSASETLSELVRPSAARTRRRVSSWRWGAAWEWTA